MEKIPVWKWLLVVAVLAVCGWSLYPPSQKLKLGLDLEGGTTLVYQVEVPEDQDAKTVIEQTISTLRKRVDPLGVLNLVWREQKGNRIEIQVPPAPPQTRKLLSEYVRLREQLLENNLSEVKLNRVLRLKGEERWAVLETLAQGDGGRKELLTNLAEAYDELERVRGPYEELQSRVWELEKEREGQDFTSSPGEKEQVQGKIDELLKQLEPLARRQNEAGQKFGQVKKELLATNIDANELEQILSLPDTAPGAAPEARAGGLKEAPISPRQAELNKLKAKHPALAGQIEAVAKAFAEYSKVKGQGQIDDPNDLIALLKGSGVLEFRIGAVPGEVPQEQRYRDQLRQRGPKAGFKEEYRWFVVDDVGGFAEEPRQLAGLKANPEGYFASRGLVGQMHGKDYYLLLANTAGRSLTREQSGWELSRAGAIRDESGYPAVGFSLNRTGGELMAELTGGNLNRPMAIVLDGRVISAPSIRSQIHDSGQITGGRGGFSQKELDYLLRTLNAGSLQGRLSDQPIYIKTFGPQLGQDNLHQGLKAAYWSLFAVSVLMLGYYFFSGLVADLALVANIVIILGVMSLFGATFTLPGIAGIILTIGMAVDANVLICERIREEQERKADGATALRLGYERAFATIVDSNLTTLITCIVLYYTATADIKGFAVTMIVGVLATMFTAVFCTRLVMDLYVRYSKRGVLTMLPTAVEAVSRLLRPNVDWVGKMPLFGGLSAAVIVVGLVFVGVRGQDLLDIEFRSGTQVGFSLAQGKTLSLGEVRERLSGVAGEFGLPALAGNRASVVTVGKVESGRAKEFTVATLETESERVSQAVKTAFEDVLDTQRPIQFVTHRPEDEQTPPYYIVNSPNLGQCIGRGNVEADVSDYLGGVATVLADMDPPATTEELRGRIQRMRMQPAFEDLGYRTFKVVGLDVAGGGEGLKYRTAVVLSSDGKTNYMDDPDLLGASGGLAETEWQVVLEALHRDTSLDSVSNFSSQVSNTMKQQALVAMGLSILAVVIYIWFRFGSLRYGLGAIVALMHDVTIPLGALAISGYLAGTWFGDVLLLSDFKINLAQVAAILTIIGYSLNDTIIVFDRIRENRGKMTQVTPKIINDAINQTISRTVMTSGTTLLAVVALYVLGGDGVHGFAFSMLIGVVVGTYSSVAIAAPILLIGLAKQAPSAAGVNKSVRPVGTGV